MAFPASFDLSSLDGSNGFILNGIDNDDFAGGSVSNAGDVNGDGIDDLIVGAFRGDPNPDGGINTSYNAGESYVIFGSTGPAGASFNLSDLDGSNGFVINGIDDSDRAGIEVNGAGDINGDGFDDLVIGADYADPNGNNNAGESYVVFGSASNGAALNLADLDGSNGFVVNGINNGDRLGRSFTGAGDVNGDGLDDVVIGAFYADGNGSSFAGESYVIFGATSNSAVLDLTNLNGTNGFTINGVANFSTLGRSVSIAGDINGDGLDDIILGANYAFGLSGAPRSGEAYVIFGATTNAATLDLSNLNGTNGFIIGSRTDPAARLGTSVSRVGDINGDGFDDVIISAIRATTGSSANAGKSYVVFGSANSFGVTLDLSTLNGTNGFVINGIDSDDFSGNSVSGTGDINGDGLDDLIIGAFLGDPNGSSNAGESYVIFGSTDGFDATLDLSDLDGLNGFVLNGIDSDDRAGSSVSGAGDINGDGINDVIIGASRGDPNGSFNAGEAYVVFGQSVSSDPTDGDDDLSGSSGDDAIELLGGDDAYSGGEGNDSVRGGEGNDTIFGDAGDDTLKGNAGNDELFGGAGNDQLGGIGGDDTLAGGLGNDFYTINSISDVIVEMADEGIDTVQSTIDFTLSSNLERLVLIEGTGETSGQGNINDNTLFGNSNNNALDGLAGDDVLYGAAGSDTLEGGIGTDILFGGDGDDLLVGGAGNDILFGDGGSDTFVFEPGSGRDAVRDFDAALDVLDLRPLFDSFGYSGNDPIGDGYLRFGVNGNNTFVQVDADAAGETSQLQNLLVLRDFTAVASLQVGQNVLV